MRDYQLFQINVALSRPGLITEQVVEGKFFRKQRVSEKSLAPRVGLQRFVISGVASAFRLFVLVLPYSLKQHRLLRGFDQFGNKLRMETFSTAVYETH